MNGGPIDEDDARLDDPIIKWKDLWESNVSDHDSLYSKFSINNTHYLKVYLFKTEFEDNDKTIVEIYFSYKKGFVGYKTQDGVIWNLVINGD